MNTKNSIEIPNRFQHLNDANKNKSSTVFTGVLADVIFSNKLVKIPLPYLWEPDDIQKKYDVYNMYTLNSHNCRGPEFFSGVDFITAGCSQTFGIGVPDDGVWPEFISKELNATYINLSMLGAGMEWITDSIFRYINTYGKPNRGIIVLVPDYYRLDILVDNELNSCSRHGITDYVPQYYDESNLDFRLVTCHLDNSYPTSYIKKPFSIDNTVLEEEAIRRSIKAIKDLEIFCEQSGIPLIWSTWHEGLERLVDSLPEDFKFKNYTSTNTVRWKSNTSEIVPSATDEEGIADFILDKYDQPIYCHFELEPKYGLAFHKGTDRFKFEKRDQSHMGVHEHIHVADAFIEKILELGI